MSINHLTLNENDIGDYRTFCKLAPPLRHEDDRQAVIAALAEGVIDVIVSDHNPQDVETKRQPFAEAADGAVGLETLLSAGLRLVHAGEIALPHFCVRCRRVRRKFSGFPADGSQRARPPTSSCSIPDAPYVLDKQTLRSRSKNTPFDEARLRAGAADDGRARRCRMDGSYSGAGSDPNHEHLPVRTGRDGSPFS